MNEVCHTLLNEVVAPGICTGCGACVALDEERCAVMEDTPHGPVPRFEKKSCLNTLALDACPGRGVDYPSLYDWHYGRAPDHGLLGCWEKVRTGYASDSHVRRSAASGGVMTQTLLYLLDSGRVDGAVVVRQGIPEADKARVQIVRTRADLQYACGSVYIPVSTLDALRDFRGGERYAMTCLPDQASALRVMQRGGFEPARQVSFVLGPYTGTALYAAAVRCFLSSKGVRRDDPVVNLQWRAGEWPGNLEIETASGRQIRARKFYYNYLIPFYVTQASLQGMDFTNEFCDLSVGDAWSPRFEAAEGGMSVVTSRSREMETVLEEMTERDLLVLVEEDPMDALSMHGHMLDFKKRGSYIRNQARRFFGRKAPDYGVRPRPLPWSRVAVECFIMLVFAVGRTRLARCLVRCIPESVMGPLFNGLRKSWKAISKPTKRKGLLNLRMERISDAG